MTNRPVKLMRNRRMLPAVFISLVTIPVGALVLLRLTSSRPDHLGVHKGRLAECPTSPNCVSTTATVESQRMDPIPFDGSPEDARQRLRNLLANRPRTKIVTDESDYLHAECTTPLFRFVDDVEFLIDADARQIHFRSASRVGHSDLGQNRRRMKEIVDSF